jgi:hypothetical protein
VPSLRCFHYLVNTFLVAISRDCQHLPSPGFHWLPVLAMILGSVPLLQGLKLDAVNTLGYDFIVALDRTCRSPFRQNHSVESPILFPSLIDMQIGSLVPTDAATWSVVRE